MGTKPFPQLSLVYGILAKFPVDLLVEKASAESKPFLIVLYDHLSSLSQRCVDDCTINTPTVLLEYNVTFIIQITSLFVLLSTLDSGLTFRLYL